MNKLIAMWNGKKKTVRRYQMTATIVVDRIGTNIAIYIYTKRIINENTNVIYRNNDEI